MQTERLNRGGKAQGPPILRYGRAAFAAAITAGLFAASLVWVLSTIQSYDVLQQDLRQARSAGSATLRLQLDMETGVRGYAITRKTVFLQPYEEGIRQMVGQLAAERHALAELGGYVPSGTANFVDTEEAMFNRWRREVAAPLIANPGRHDAKRLEVVGKQFIDRFRAANTAVANVLQATSQVADLGFRRSIARIAVFGLFGFVVIAAVTWAITIAVGRAGGEAQRQRVLYEIEKQTLDSLIKAFLPAKLPAFAGVELSAVYLPAEREALVGGDWFDALVLPDGRLFVSVGDVGGHGIAAAVTMNRARQILLAQALNEQTPGAMLERANELLNLQGEGMVTALCGFVSSDRSTFVYASAGHPPPAFVDLNGAACFLELGGLPLGVLKGPSYSSSAVETQPGAMIVLYTDGLTESRRDVMTGEAQLLAATERLWRERHADPALAIRDSVLAQGSPLDDVAVLTLTFTQSESPTKPASSQAAKISPGPSSRIRVD